jgi:hypothetical protein
MKKTILITAILIFSLIGFLLSNKHLQLTSFHIPLFSVPSGYVRVDFVNKSDETIKFISLSSSELNIKDIKIGERRTVIFKHSGDGTYQFVVEFSSGKKIKESDRYIEGGYFLTESIFSNEVKTKY